MSATVTAIRNNIGVESWDKVYWILRMLINTDGYDGPGRDTDAMKSISVLVDSLINENHPFFDLKKMVFDELYDLLVPANDESKRSGKRKQFLCDLQSQLLTFEDIRMFGFVCGYMIAAANDVMEAVVSRTGDAHSARLVKQLLTQNGAHGVSEVIYRLDRKGYEDVLTLERDLLVGAFDRLNRTMQSRRVPVDARSVVSTAFVQEMERRLAQKRKVLAGGGLKSALKLIFKHYKISVVADEKDIDAKFNLDMVVQAYDGRMIGLVAKRTNRDRLKQVSGYASGKILRSVQTPYGEIAIDEIWHIMVMDDDLSDKKIRALPKEHRLFLHESSQRFEDFVKYPRVHGLSDLIGMLS